MNDEIQVTDQTQSPEQEVPETKPVSTFRLVATLGVAGMLAGLLLVLVNQHTKPLIDAYKAEQLQKAVYEVTPGTDRYDTYYLVDEALITDAAGRRQGKRVQAHLCLHTTPTTNCTAWPCHVVNPVSRTSSWSSSARPEHRQADGHEGARQQGNPGTR